jgi:hypothetical protein
MMRKDKTMTLRERFLDALRDGRIGKDGIVTRREFMTYFSDENPQTTGCFLSNSEMTTGAVHSPNYNHFTIRLRKGVYRVHEEVIKNVPEK